jgi:autotransporter translocation and assembly factor TamB
VNGSQGLDGSLDYIMTMLLPEKTSAKVNVPGFVGQAAELFKDESGRLKLDFAVGGTMDDPKVALDTRSAQNRAQELAKQKVASEAKKVEDQLKKKAEDAIQGIFKRKK